MFVKGVCLDMVVIYGPIKKTIKTPF